MVAAVAQQPMLDPLDEADAEDIILAFCAVLLGDRGTDPKDRGLMSQIIAGRQHIERCQRGMWIQAGDSLRGGQPCSTRCLNAQVTLDAAARWLKAREATR